MSCPTLDQPVTLSIGTMSRPHLLEALKNGGVGPNESAMLANAICSTSGTRCTRALRCRGYLTAPALRPATKLRCNSRNPTTIGTLTTSDAAMI